MNFRTLFGMILLALLPLFSLYGKTRQELEMLGYINSERIRTGAVPLRWDEDLYPTAREHSEDMAARGEVSHLGTDGRDSQARILDTNVYASKTGENVARDISVTSAHTVLMQSLYHRDNILDPEFTHVAIGIVEKDSLFYVTQVFIRKVGDYSLEQARLLLLKQYNHFREQRKMNPVITSSSLNTVAQSHAELQEKWDRLTPLLTMGVLSRHRNGSMQVSVYTTSSLLEIPMQVQSDLGSGSDQIGIGFRRVRGSFCTSGCYLVVLIRG